MAPSLSQATSYLSLSHPCTCLLNRLPVSCLAPNHPFLQQAFRASSPKRKPDDSPPRLKTHYGFPWNKRRKSKLCHDLAITGPSGQTDDKKAPLPLGRQQPHSPVHTGMPCVRPARTWSLLRLFLLPCHLSQLSHSTLSSTISQLCPALSCLWPLPMLLSAWNTLLPKAEP